MQYDGGHLKKLPSKFHERRLHIWPCAERRLHIWLAQSLLNSVTECKCPSTKKLQSQYFLHIRYTMTATEEWLETRTRQQAAEPTQPTQRGKRHRPSSRSIRPPSSPRLRSQPSCRSHSHSRWSRFWKFSKFVIILKVYSIQWSYLLILYIWQMFKISGTVAPTNGQ